MTTLRGNNLVFHSYAMQYAPLSPFLLLLSSRWLREFGDFFGRDLKWKLKESWWIEREYQKFHLPPPVDALMSCAYNSNDCSLQFWLFSLLFLVFVIVVISCLVYLMVPPICWPVLRWLLANADDPPSWCHRERYKHLNTGQQWSPAPAVTRNIITPPHPPSASMDGHGWSITTI